MSTFLSIFANSTSLTEDYGVTQKQLSELVALFYSRVPEIRRFNQELNKSGLRLALYGGTSREVLDEIIEGIAKHGSYESYKNFLNESPSISYLDWHRLGSDLDFYIMGEDKPENRRVVNDFVGKFFPPSLFYKSVDVLWPDEFFAKFPPAKEHFEATSNILISSEGFEYPKGLDASVNGEKKHLGEWGIEQYLKGEFEFIVNRALLGTEDVYRDFRQILRWVRYLSERPGMRRTEQSDREIKLLLNEILTHHKEKLYELLRQGNSFTTKASSIAEKLVEALEKLQLYSGDAFLTHQLLIDTGLEQVFKEAGIADQRVLKPLRHRTAEENQRAADMASRKRPLSLNHRTHIVAAQSMSRGALWVSNNETIISGQKTTSAMADAALYAAPNFESIGYGDFHISLELSADAIEGIDYVKLGTWYAIKTREALVAKGETKISLPRLKANDLIENSLLLLATEGLNENQISSVLRTLASLFRPAQSEEDRAKFGEVLASLKSSDLRQIFLAKAFRQNDFLVQFVSNNLDPILKQHLVDFLLMKENLNKFDYEGVLVTLAKIIYNSENTDRFDYVLENLPRSEVKNDLIRSLFGTEDYQEKYKAGNLPEQLARATSIYWENLETIDDKELKSVLLDDGLSMEFVRLFLKETMSEDSAKERILSILSEAQPDGANRLSRVLAGYYISESVDVIVEQLVSTSRKIKNLDARDSFIQYLMSKSNVGRLLDTASKETREKFNAFISRGVNSRAKQIPQSVGLFFSSFKEDSLANKWERLEPVLESVKDPKKQAHLVLAALGFSLIADLFEEEGIPEKPSRWIEKNAKTLSFVLFNESTEHETLDQVLNAIRSYEDLSKAPAELQKLVLQILEDTFSSKYHRGAVIDFFDDDKVNQFLLEYSPNLWERFYSVSIESISYDSLNKNHWEWIANELKKKDVSESRIRKLAEILTTEPMNQEAEKIQSLFQKPTYNSFRLYLNMENLGASHISSFPEALLKTYKDLDERHTEALNEASPRKDRLFPRLDILLDFYKREFDLSSISELHNFSISEKWMMFFSWGEENLPPKEKQFEEKKIVEWIAHQSDAKEISEVLDDLLDSKVKKLQALLSKTKPQLSTERQMAILRNFEHSYTLAESWEYGLKYAAGSYRLLISLLMRNQESLSHEVVQKIVELAEVHKEALDLLPKRVRSERSRWWTKFAADNFGFTAESKDSERTGVFPKALPVDSWVEPLYDLFLSVWQKAGALIEEDSEGRRVGELNDLLVANTAGLSEFPDSWKRKISKDLTGGLFEEVLASVQILAANQTESVLIKFERSLSIALERFPAEQRFELILKLSQGQAYESQESSRRIIMNLIQIHWDSLAELPYNNKFTLGWDSVLPIDFLAYGLVLSNRGYHLYTEAESELVHKVLYRAQNNADLLWVVADEYRSQLMEDKRHLVLEFMSKMKGWRNPTADDKYEVAKLLTDFSEAQEESPQAAKSSSACDGMIK